MENDPNIPAIPDGTAKDSNQQVNSQALAIIEKPEEKPVGPTTEE